MVSMFMLPFNGAWAGMIGTEQAMVAAGAQAERAAVLSVISRADVASQLNALGLDQQTARARVAAMTDEEVRTLAGRIEAVPAGADGGWGWVIVVIVVAAVVWYVWK